MNPKNKFWWFAGASMGLTFVAVGVIIMLMWNQLLPDQKIVLLEVLKGRFGHIFGCVFILMAGVVFGLDAIVHNYVIPTNKMIEETTLINSVNPSHRIQIEGSRDCIRLAQVINETADRHQALQRDVDQKIQLAKAEAEDEKNTLAAFMAELPEGVVVCNADGRILLYNREAKHLLGCGMADAAGGLKESDVRFIGLGRSIFGAIDKHLIVHALDEIADKLRRKEARVSSYFVIARREGGLLRAEAVPVLKQETQLTGFILILNDITRQLEAGTRVDSLMQSFTKGIRASLGSIRAAIEAILEYPDMDTKQLNIFSKIIYDESVHLSHSLDRTEADYMGELKSEWPLVQMSVKDFLEMIGKKAHDKLGITIDIKATEENNWVKVDTYSIGLAVLFVMSQLKDAAGTRKFACSAEREGRFVNLDLLWQGSPMKMDTLREWEDQPLLVGNEGIPLTLKEVMGHHEAEIWSHSCGESGKKTVRLLHKTGLFKKNRSYLRLLLPAVATSEPDTVRSIMVVSESRPEFYDFDLFNRPGQSLEMDNQPLTTLTYTVFDTETTGLDPNTDEIISIGAVRIVNGHLRHDDIFDQLIDPKRDVPDESVRIHGIHPEMLNGQPVIGKVLPLFHRFAEDTVLVGHNAAFDMRMLEMKEEQTGVRFINPVLDTLLLSAVIHPAQENHSMERIAKRLGISIVGRHTALGDAISTGEIFVKLISLLTKSGIRTLKDARTASQKTYYARLKY